MRKYTNPEIQVKAAGGVRTLDGLLEVKALGVTRLGASATASILEDAKKRFGTTNTESPAFAEGKGY